MASRWSNFALDELVDEIIDRRGVTPTKLESTFMDHGHQVISAKAIKQSRVNLSIDEPRFINSATYQRWMKTPLRRDDVLLTSEAPIGEAAYVHRDVDWCLGQRLFGIRTKKDRLLGRYLYYALQTKEVQHELLSRASGTTAQGIRQSELRRVHIPTPPLATQERIANVLSAIDDRIDLNHRMTETLEAMTAALFKSWFIDLDPVRARTEGREHSLPVHLANLFPHRFSSSELGLIPEGWAVEPLGKIADQLRETEHPGDSPSTSFSHHSIPAYDSDMIPVEESGSSIKSHKTIIKPGAVLISRLNPEIERVWLTDVVDGERAICSTEFLVLVPRHPFTTGYLYSLARSRAFRGRLVSLVTCTSRSHQRAPVRAVMSMDVLVPPTDVIAAFDQCTRILLDRVLRLRRETVSLESLRDLSLPKLVSGDLRANLGDAPT